MASEDNITDAFAACITTQCKAVGLPKCKLSGMLDRRPSYISDITGSRKDRYIRTLPLWMVRRMASIFNKHGADGDLLLRHAYTYIALRDKEAA